VEPTTDGADHLRSQVPVEAVRPRDDELVWFAAGDGTRCNLVHVRGERPASRGPVLLVHGAGVRANIFRAPVPTTLVDVLVDDGYDVWLENWRASIDLPPTRWTLDQAAAYDHPQAVRTVLERSGADTLKAVVHCQGSTSFVMSAVAGLLPEVTTIVTNAVSLHPVVPPFSRIKLSRLAPTVAELSHYLDPSWGDKPPTLLARVLVLGVRLVHRECHNSVCRMVSFVYGAGFPALWSHRHLNDATHEWLRQEFGEVPLTFFQQMAECVRRGHMVAAERLPGLPEDYTSEPPQTDARFFLLAGSRNHCFLPASQARTFAFLDRHRPGYHRAHTLRGYGHLDVFMGKDAARDVFPIIREALDTR
jgi:hypothetical protein